MKDLNEFVEMWERTRNIEEIISQNLVLPPTDDVQAYLSTLSDNEHRRIRDSLDSALTALTAHAAGMEKESKILKAQIEKNIQVSNACLVYNKIPRKTDE